MSTKISLELTTYQDLEFRKNANGKLMPILTESIYFGNSDTPVYENNINLESIIDSLTKSMTLVNGEMKKQDKKELVEYLDSIIDLIKDKKKEVKEIPEWNKK